MRNTELLYSVLQLRKQAQLASGSELVPPGTTPMAENALREGRGGRLDVPSKPLPTSKPQAVPVPVPVAPKPVSTVPDPTDAMMQNIQPGSGVGMRLKRVFGAE